MTFPDITRLVGLLLIQTKLNKKTTSEVLVVGMFALFKTLPNKFTQIV